MQVSTRRSLSARPRNVHSAEWLALGLVVVAIGVFFFLDAIGALNAIDVFSRWWPLLIIVAGILAFVGNPPALPLGTVLVGTGIVVLLFTTAVFGQHVWRYVWPSLIVLAGFAVVFRRLGPAAVSAVNQRGNVRSRAFHVRSRMARLRAAEGLGRVIEWMCTAGRPAFLTLALAVASLLWLDWWTVLLLYVVLLLAWFAAKAKTRVVVETFDDHTTTPQGGHSRDGAPEVAQTDPRRPDTTGMAGLLASKLAEMRGVYQLLEEPLGRPHAGPVEGAIQVEDIGDVLRSAFTTQSNLSVGAITLPVGGLMTLLGRLVQAPRLRGAIYGDDRELTITAALAMHGHDYVWAVSGHVGEADKTSTRTASQSVSGEENETPSQARRRMTGELAYRIFTELSLRGQAEWPATRYWLDALSERQACQRAPRDRRLHLENAESFLRKALSADEHFYLAAYNLGIVYRQLAEEDAKRMSPTELRTVPQEPYTRSALRLFAYAINTLDRGRWEAYYGLALAYWKLTELSVGDTERRCRRIVDQCDQALELASGRAARAQILDLQAMGQSKLGWAPAALATRHRACSLAMRELMIAELWRVPSGDGQRMLRLRKQASQCLLNLAIAYHDVESMAARQISDMWPKAVGRWARARRFGRIHGLVAAAMDLADVDAEAHARVATIAQSWGQDAIALQELQHAIRLRADNPCYWSERAKLCADLGQRDAARTACVEAERAIDFGSAVCEDEITPLVVAYEKIDDVAAANAVKRRRQLADAIARSDALAASSPDRARKELKDELSRCNDGNSDWEAAIVEWHLGLQLLESDDEKDAAEAETHFSNARKHLTACGREVNIRRWGLLGAEARAIARQFDRTRDALPLAERGVAIDPLSRDAWRALAIVREHGRDYERACAAWNHVHLLDPEDPDCRVTLALCQWKYAGVVASPQERRRLHREAIDHLHASLRLYDSAQMTQRRQTEWWTAKCHWLLGEFAEMPPHLLFILASLETTRPSKDDTALTALVELTLAQSYRQATHFYEAERLASDSMKHADRAYELGFPAGARPGAPFREHHWSLDEIRALARAEFAGCHADRNGRLPVAEACCRDAEDIVHALKDEGTDATEIESEVLTERGRIELARDHPDKAVHLLERATGLDPGKAGSYVALARAYERLSTEREGREAQLTRNRARESCKRAKEIVAEAHPQWVAAHEVEQRIDTDELEALTVQGGRQATPAGSRPQTE